MSSQTGKPLACDWSKTQLAFVTGTSPSSNSHSQISQFSDVSARSFKAGFVVSGGFIVVMGGFVEIVVEPLVVKVVGSEDVSVSPIFV